MKNRSLFILIIGTILLASCSLPLGFTATPTVEAGPPLPPTATTTISLPTNTPEPTMTPTITPTATLPSYKQMKVSIGVEVLNLRSGPGEQFDIVDKLPKGTILWILGRARGDDWFLVRSDTNRAGWVSASFVALKVPLSTIPIFEVTDALIITGKAVDNMQNPVPGINFAIFQGTGADQKRIDVYSDGEGKFYAYLPGTATGSWTVEYVGILCTSPIMDANCKFSGHFANNSFTITLPQDIEIPLIFEYIP